jgi:hypothetical protein
MFPISNEGETNQMSVCRYIRQEDEAASCKPTATLPPQSFRVLSHRTFLLVNEKIANQNNHGYFFSTNAFRAQGAQ